MIHRIRAGTPVFPETLEPNRKGLVAVGGDLSVETLTEAYSKGLFPWTGEEPIPWYSPDPRAVLRPGQFHTSHSLRKRLRQMEFEVRFDWDFAATIDACASVFREGEQGTWITPNMIRAYNELHELGIAHSVETYRVGRLVGGLYGLTFGSAFFGESMFAVDRDASKIAMHALCRRLEDWEFHFIDCQAVTQHLVSLGATPVPRRTYLLMLRDALATPRRLLQWVQTESGPAEGF